MDELSLLVVTSAPAQAEPAPEDAPAAADAFAPAKQPAPPDVAEVAKQPAPPDVAEVAKQPAPPDVAEVENVVRLPPKSLLQPCLVSFVKDHVPHSPIATDVLATCNREGLFTLRALQEYSAYAWLGDKLPAAAAVQLTQAFERTEASWRPKLTVDAASATLANYAIIAALLCNMTAGHLGKYNKNDFLYYRETVATQWPSCEPLNPDPNVTMVGLSSFTVGFGERSFSSFDECIDYWSEEQNEYYVRFACLAFMVNLGIVWITCLLQIAIRTSDVRQGRPEGSARVRAAVSQNLARWIMVLQLCLLVGFMCAGIAAAFCMQFKTRTAALARWVTICAYGLAAGCVFLIPVVILFWRRFGKAIASARAADVKEKHAPGEAESDKLMVVAGMR